MKEGRSAQRGLGKLAALVVILVCLVLGVLGLVLPIAPGLIFLLAAAVLAARTFPCADGWLRRSRTIGSYLDKTDPFLELPLADKLKVAALICLKGLADSLAMAAACAAKLYARVTARRGRA